MTRVFKLRSERKGEHVYTTVFSGFEGQTFCNCGTLVMVVGEWQEFGAALLLGVEQMRGRVKIVCEGDQEVVDGCS